MKRTLVRAGFNPTKNTSVNDVVAKNLVRGNLGNMIFAGSIFRTLMIKQEQDLLADGCVMNNLDAPWINDEFERYIIPLADIFRVGASGEINRITSLVKALDMPCIIVGAGARADTFEKLKEKQPFDDEVKGLIDAVLEKSSCIGIRGEMTGEYLKRFGYREGKEYRIIGCPSMFTHGKIADFETPSLDESSKICVNSSILAKNSTIDFLNGVLDTYKNSTFMTQRYEEMLTLYLGCDYVHRLQKQKPQYPRLISDSIYAQNRVKMFADPTDWVRFLEKADLSIGARMHGNIAALIAGTPSVIIPHGVRMEELVSYHALPFITSQELTKCKTLDDVFEKVDFKSVSNVFDKNFENYKDFLKENGVPTIFDRKDGVVPYDIALKNRESKEVTSVVNLTKEETIKRWTEYSETRYLYKNAQLERLREDFHLLNRTPFTSDVKDLFTRVTDRISHRDRPALQRRGLNTHSEEFYE